MFGFGCWVLSFFVACYFFYFCCGVRSICRVGWVHLGLLCWGFYVRGCFVRLGSSWVVLSRLVLSGSPGAPEGWCAGIGAGIGAGCGCMVHGVIYGVWSMVCPVGGVDVCGGMCVVGCGWEIGRGGLWVM